MAKIIPQNLIIQFFYLITVVAWLVTISKSKNLSQTNTTEQTDDCNPYCLDSATQLNLGSTVVLTSFLRYVLE